MTMPAVDYAKFYNPYDFANPVSESDLFIGRKEELQEIQYYLDEAGKAPRPLNLALLGPRASGKTSLLNMVDIEAHKRGFCVVRIDLNESDVISPMGFFFKLFDSIFHSVCEFELQASEDGQIHYPFEGIAGKTYQTYIEIIATGATPQEPQWQPFLFPLQYAKSLLSGIDLINSRISDHTMKRDFDKLRQECKKTIVILFDESDCINQNVVLLEMLRNIFMNMPGYMLVFAGLPTLFPLMNDVFSPIIRQFKRIEVGAFPTPAETQDCIEKPLKSLGIESSSVFEVETYVDIREIHDLASGRPYEINLICHFLFKRLQRGMAAKMRLNLGVLEDVRKELEKEQDISSRPVIAALRKMTNDDIKKLNQFSICDGTATFDQLWHLNTIFSKRNEFSKDHLNEDLEYFLKIEVLRIRDNNYIEFAGDDFDKIYAKYYARENGVALQIIDIPIEVLAISQLRSVLTEIDGIQPLYEPIYSNLRVRINLAEIIRAMGDDPRTNDLYVKDPPYINALLRIATDCKQDTNIILLLVTIETQFLNTSTYFYVNNHKVSSQSLEEVDNAVAMLESKAKLIGGSLTKETIDIEFPPLEKIIHAVRETQNKNLRANFAGVHASQVAMHYCTDKDLGCACHHANIAFQFLEELEPIEINNIGYVFLRNKEFKRAEQCFQNGLDKSDNDLDSKVLLSYNFAVCMFMSDQKNDAIDFIGEVRSMLLEEPETNKIYACLLVPAINPSGDLEFVERWEHRILMAVDEFEEIISNLH